MTGRFAGRTAVVTGGANGIGRACASAFAQGGAKVALLDVERSTLEEVAGEISETGRTCHAIALDLTDGNAVEEAFREIDRVLGPVDILLNNVGQTARERSSEFWCSKPEVWEFVLDVSLVTTLRCSRQVVPGMRERRSGKIVNIASDSPLYGDVMTVDYSAAKGGVIGLTRSLARELAPFRVNVNCVCPGVTNTRGPRRLPPEVLQAAKAAIPMGEINEPSDIANGVGFLASEEARFITGQLLVINGGRVFY